MHGEISIAYPRSERCTLLHLMSFCPLPLSVPPLPSLAFPLRLYRFPPFSLSPSLAAERGDRAVNVPDLRLLEMREPPLCSSSSPTHASPPVPPILLLGNS
eukprot:1516292-Rhodomonas_salina.1